MTTDNVLAFPVRTAMQASRAAPLAPTQLDATVRRCVYLTPAWGRDLRATALSGCYFVPIDAFVEAR